MIIHNFDPVLIDLGLFQIRWYSIAYIMGIVFGWIYAKTIIKKTSNNKYGFEQIKSSNFDDLILYLVLGIIVGGRMGYVIFYNLEYFAKNSFEIFKVWHGGMSFHGGLLGIVAAVLIFSKKFNISFFKISDIVACVAPIGIFFGRVSNFINAELYGKASSLPWAIVFPNAGNISRHPSQIYEAILEGIILFIVINFLAFNKKLLFKPGYISGLFLISYSTLRIFSEIFREPDKHLGYFFNYLSMGILLSIGTLIAGFVIVFTIKKK
ncbi:prolipoprotein diacylglyceryl transferase [Pelagibacteraceae bacterium]|nr:prolipoprotein diacylglyceryl transferase [Pelagibacteraceae bacterium]